MTAPRVRAYLRVSKDDGTQTTDNQLPDVQALCARRGWTLERVHVEQGSAVKARPVWAEVQADARARKFDVLVVWRLDRLGRSMVGNLDAVLRLEKAGVRVVSVSEEWLDTSGPTRDLLLAIFSWVAEQERRTLVDRTHAGLRRAKAEGIRLGRPSASGLSLGAARLALLAGGTMAEAAKRSGVSVPTLYRKGLRVCSCGSLLATVPDEPDTRLHTAPGCVFAGLRIVVTRRTLDAEA